MSRYMAGLKHRHQSSDFCFLNAHIAQSVEQFLGKEEVTGSNPVVGSTVKRAKLKLTKSA